MVVVKNTAIVEKKVSILCVFLLLLLMFSFPKEELLGKYRLQLFVFGFVAKTKEEKGIRRRRIKGSWLEKVKGIYIMPVFK